MTTKTKLLSSKQHKAMKAGKLGYLQGIQQLQPLYRLPILGQKNTCPAAGACGRACLQFAGCNNGILNKHAPNARIARTMLWSASPEVATEQIIKELTNLYNKAERESLLCCARLNGLSDVLFPRSIYDAFNGKIQFLDYTKVAERLFQDVPDNLFLTYSYNEKTPVGLVERIYNETRFNVSMVFAGELPETWTVDGITYPVCDGDETDLRFLDPAGHIVGLRYKHPSAMPEKERDKLLKSMIAKGFVQDNR